MNLTEILLLAVIFDTIMMIGLWVNLSMVRHSTGKMFLAQADINRGVLQVCRMQQEDLDKLVALAKSHA